MPDSPPPAGGRTTPSSSRTRSSPPDGDETPGGERPGDGRSAAARTLTQTLSSPLGLVYRSGIGYDSHRFAPGGPLRLGGVDIPADVHLQAHSDGDAIAHALTDAILGAASAGDIGALFPDNDPTNRGRDSIEMLRIAVSRIRALGWDVENADVTVVAERPRIGPQRDAMRQVLAAALGIDGDRVSVKGKSNEGMGWIGRGEGLACIAAAMLVRRTGE